MRRTFRFQKIVFITCMLLFLLPISVYALEVSFHAGDATLLRNNKKIAIKVGTKLLSGDILKTGNNGLVEIVYKDNSKIIIREKSTIKIGNTAIKDSNNASLLLGSITAKFSKLQKERKVYTPTSVASIRGTEFNVKVSKSGNSRIDLAEGKLNINNPYGETDLNPDENTAVKVGSGPDKNSQGKTDEWANEQDKALDEKPEDNAQAYKKYIKTFKNRNKSLRKEIIANKTDVKKAKSKEDFVQAEQKIDASEEKIEDDLILNDTANGAIQLIIDNFKNQKNKIYKDFEQLKKESNKVLEVQRKSYQDIQAVKDAHRKAYEAIMGGFKDNKDTIKDSVDFDSVKPKFNKKKKSE